MADAPLQRLHAAHRSPDDGDKPANPERIEQPRWLATMSRIVKRGKARSGWVRLLLGDVVSPLPIASAQMMKWWSGIERPAGPDQKVQPMMDRADRRQDKDDIVVGGCAGPCVT